MDSTQVEILTLLFCMGSFAPDQFIISSLCFPGILQVFGTARFSQRFAYHHLWCHQTCAWNSYTESFEMREVDGHVSSDVKMRCILLIFFFFVPFFLSHTFKHFFCFTVIHFYTSFLYFLKSEKHKLVLGTFFVFIVLKKYIRKRTMRFYSVATCLIKS